MIKVHSLFSGSGGNCTLAESGDTRILIDAGGTAKQIKEGLRALGLSPADISAVFITHEHRDHVAALPVLIKNCNAAIHVAEPCRRKSVTLAEPQVYEATVSHSPEGFTERAGCLTVEALPVPHDSAACVAYILRDDGGDSFALCTDMGYVTNRLAAAVTGVRQIILESNHDEEMLEKGDYPDYLKRRILGREGHLSNRIAAMFAVHLAKSGAEKIMLGHLSENNNTPEVAYNTVHNALLAEGLSPKLTVSSQYEMREL